MTPGQAHPHHLTVPPHTSPPRTASPRSDRSLSGRLLAAGPLARFQLSTGFGLAVSPVVITALAAHGQAALWASLAAATLLSAAAVTR